MNIENERTRDDYDPTPATPKSMPDRLDQLADSLSNDRHPHSAIDIKAAADEIRKLKKKVDQLAAGMAEVASREDQLASALFGLIEDRVQSLVETELDNYDPTDHYNFSDAVAEHSSEPDEDRTRDIVREVLDGGSFTFHP
jgi:predicted transcriptional regulator